MPRHTPAPLEDDDARWGTDIAAALGDAAALGPWRMDLSPPERRARTRDLRAVCMVRLGPMHRLTLALAVAEAGSEQGRDAAAAALSALGPDTRAGILADYHALLRAPVVNPRRTRNRSA